MTSPLPEPLPETLVGRVIGDRFRVIGLIARSAMGRVYRAEQLPLGRLVAIKTLEPLSRESLAKDPRFQERFFVEAAVASRLRHPNTVSVFDYGTTPDGLFFMAMELVEGRSLFRVIREDGPLPAERATRIALQIARSLREAHCLDILHRALKPGNVLLEQRGDESDFVKVLDFGLVRRFEPVRDEELAKVEPLLGSPEYMSPEQIQGDPLDARSDIYALGLVLYEMLCGHAPIEHESELQLLLARTREAAPPLPVEVGPEPLRNLIMRCLEKSPDARPSSVDEVILALKYAMGAKANTTGSFKVITPDIAPPTPMPAAASGTLSLPARISEPPPVPIGPAASSPAARSEGAAGPRWLPPVAVATAVVISAGFLTLRFWETRDAGRGAEAPELRLAAAPTPAQRERTQSGAAKALAERVHSPPDTTSVPAAHEKPPEPAAIASAQVTAPRPTRSAAANHPPSPPTPPSPRAGAGGRQKPQKPGEIHAPEAPQPPAARAPSPPTQKFVKARALPGNDAPSYPRNAQRRGIEGDVWVSFDILPNGQVANAKVEKGPPELHATVLETVATWRYQPPTLDGKPVARRIKKVFRFRQL